MTYFVLNRDPDLIQMLAQSLLSIFYSVDHQCNIGQQPQRKPKKGDKSYLDHMWYFKIKI